MHYPFKAKLIKAPPPYEVRGISPPGGLSPRDVSWIKTYGKGRVYCTPLGHTPILYTSPQWEQHMLAAVQYMLGDLDADATPSAKIKQK